MTKALIKVLLIEDNPADALLLKESLSNDLLADFQVTVAEHLKQGFAELEAKKFDVLLLDLGLPDSQGLETFERAHWKFPDLPIVVLSGMTNELLALQAVQSGAQDYLVKSETGWGMGPRAIRYAIERHQAQSAMRASEARFSTFFHFSPIPTAITRLSDNKIIEVNEAWVQITGYSSAEVVGRSLGEFNLWVNPERRKEIVRMLRKDGILRGIEYQTQRKSGELADMLFSAELIELAGEPCMLSMALDITERKRSEAKIHFQATLLAAVGQAVIATDLAGTVIYFNQAAEKLYGWSVAEALGRNIMEINVPAISQAQAVEIMDHLSTGKTWSGEFMVQRRDGTIFPAAVSDSPVADETGKLIGIIGISADVTERKQAEEKLRKLSRAVEQSPTSIIITDLLGNIEYVNPKFSEVTGYEFEEALGQNPRFQKSEDTPREKHKEMWDTILSGNVWMGELLNKKKNGEKYWENATIAPVFTEDGKITNFLAVKEDITKRKQAEEALRESEEIFRVIFEQANDAIHIEDADDKILAVNSRMCKLMGYSREELLKMHVADLQAPELRQPGAVLKNELARHGNSLFEALNLHRDRRRIPVEISIGTIERPTGNLYISVVRDITERRRAEEALQQAEAKYRNIFENAVEGIFQSTPAGKFFTVNQALARMLGYDSPEELIANVNDINHNFYIQPGRREEFMRQLNKNNIITNFESEVQRKDGGTIWMSENARVIHDDLGQMFYYEGTFEDITERKHAEEALRESEDRYRSIFDSVQDAIFLETKDGRISEVNNRACDMYGYSRDEFIGKTVKDLVPEGRDILYPSDTQSNISSSPLETINRRANGDLFPIEVSGGLQTINGEEIFLVIVRDITERKQVELALEESQRRLVTLMANLPGMAFRCKNDSEWSMEFVSEGCYPLTGYHAAELINNASITYGQVIHPEDRQMTWNIIQTQLEKKQPYQLNYRIITASGDDRWVWEQGQGVYGIDGNLLALEGFIADITAREHAEEVIHQRVKELELLYENGLVFSQLLNPKQIAQKIIELLGEKLNWHHTAIRLIRAQDELELVAFDQPDLEDKAKERSVEAHFNRLISRVDEGLSGWALQQSKIIRIGDVSSDPHYVATYPGIHSGLYVPLKSGERVIGVISIESEQPNAFSETDEKLIATLANQAANAFENARLYEEISRYAEDLEQRVKERTAEIESTRRRLELVVRTAGIGIWELDIKQNKDYWDDRLFTLYGLSKESASASSQTWHNTVHPDDLAQQIKLLDESLHNHQPYNSEFRVIWPDASVHHIKSTGVVIHDAAGLPERMIGANQDITIHRQAEDALNLANAEMERGLRIKNEFLANMSHELRTPLNAILGISESLEEQVSGRLNEKQLKYVRVINESGRHLLDMINDILDLSKIEAGKLEINIHSLSVEKLCTSSLRMIKELAQKKSLNMSFKFDEKVKVILGDERRLKQSLVNLLGNAVKFTPQGKKIGLEVSGNPETNEVTFTIWDEGIGINQADMARLFKPFVQLNAGLTRAYSGTGLGLAVVAQMIRMHGGRIDLTSELNVGSRFMITLPWLPAEQEVQATVKSQVVADKPKTGGKRAGKILIVDDTEVVAQLISEYLRHKGYQTLIALDGQEGVLLAKQEHPQIIFMDVMMPVMNGLDATRQIRADASLKDVPIIALTALAMPDDREQCLAAGMSDYLSKPIQIQELTQIIERHLIQANKSQTG